MLALARRLALAKEWTEAIGWQKKGIAASEGFTAPLWADLGDFYLRMGDPAAAKASLDKSLALDKYNYAAHRILAEFFLTHAKPHEAAQEYRFLLRYYPFRERTLYSRASEAFRMAGNLQESERAQEQGLRVFPPLKVE